MEAQLENFGEPLNFSSDVLLAEEELTLFADSPMITKASELSPYPVEVTSPQSDVNFFSDSETPDLPSIMNTEIDFFEGISFVSNNDCELPIVDTFSENSSSFNTPICSDDDCSNSSFIEEDYADDDEDQKQETPKKRKQYPKRQAKQQKGNAKQKKAKVQMKEEYYPMVKSESNSSISKTKSPKKSSGSSKKQDDKYQKRLIANKKSAQASRERKKALKMKLEESVTTLTNSNVQLSAEIEKLETENRVLKKEFANLKALIGESSLLTDMMGKKELEASLGEKKLEELIPVAVAAAGSTVASALGKEEASMYLMMILYSISQRMKNGGNPINTSNLPNIAEIQGLLNRSTSSPVMV